jgi:hypothetical protein
MSSITLGSKLTNKMMNQKEMNKYKYSFSSGWKKEGRRMRDAKEEKDEDEEDE